MLFDPILSLYLLISLEYIILGAWLTYTLIKLCRNQYRLPTQAFTFCTFAALFCLTRMALVLLLMYQVSIFLKGAMTFLGFLFRFTGISEITRYWYYTYRYYISTMNMPEICPYELENITRHQKLGFFVGNIVVYIIFIVLAVLYGVGYIPDLKDDFAMPWVFRVYQGFLSLVMLTCLYVSGYKLIKIINTYSTLRPTRLIANMIVALIAYFYETVIVFLIMISPTLFGGTDTAWGE